MNTHEVLKKILSFVCKIHLILRNFAWITGIILFLFLALYSKKCYGCLWPTPVPVPTEIHIPTPEDIYEQHEREQQAKDEYERFLQEEARKRASEKYNS